MNNEDFELHNIPMLLGANKSKEYQNQIIRLSTSLLKFLKENHLLINVEPFDLEGNLKTDFILMESAVTEDGFDLFKKYVPGWLKYLNKSTVENKYENISRLEKGLAKIRELKNL